MIKTPKDDPRCTANKAARFGTGTKVIWLLATLIANTPIVLAENLPQLWFSSAPRSNYADLFELNSPWPIARSHLGVFTFQGAFVSQVGVATLTKFIKYLDENHIALALEASMMTIGKDGCGSEVEGYRPPETMPQILHKIRDAGGRLQYIAMDEELWFGHFATRQPGSGQPCQMSVSEVARNLTTNVSIARSLFPDVQIGEELPVPNIFRQKVVPVPSNYLDQVQGYIDAYATATGHPLSFIHFDVGWTPSGDQNVDKQNAASWPNRLRDALKLVTKNRIRTGIFYTGNPTDRSGKEWIDHAMERSIQVEKQLRLTFDDVIFETWMPYPKLILPETDPEAITNLIDRYIMKNGQ
jgi:hypothetical protein